MSQKTLLEAQQRKQTKIKHREKRGKKIEQSIRELWSNFKLPHICIIRILEEKEEADTESI